MWRGSPRPWAKALGSRWKFFFPFDFNGCRVWPLDNHCHVNGKLLSIFVLISCSWKIQDQKHWRMKSLALFVPRVEKAWITAAKFPLKASWACLDHVMEEWLCTALPNSKDTVRRTNNWIVTEVFALCPPGLGTRLISFLLPPLLPFSFFFFFTLPWYCLYLLLLCSITAPFQILHRSP